MPIHISISKQLLTFQKNNVTRTYSISTAKNGAGEKKNSFQTPRGKHIVCEKIGEGLPIFSVFTARKPTGEIFSMELAKQFPERDWILTRILWLAGCEIGKNKGGDVDTQSRFIYIHGTNDEDQIGRPVSHGCIRMKNAEIMTLFSQVEKGEAVLIE